MIQGGAGTSTNMNANEVIANLALKALGHAPGDYARLHPNDHVNRSQSTNDVYPTAIRLAVLEACAPLRAEQQRLADAFAERARAFAPVIKVGRTQLQDAVPMTLGMEFAGFAATVEEDIARLGELAALLREVNLGGTAIGTGVTTPAGYAALAVRHLAAISGEPLVEARDRIEASSDLGAFVTVSGVLKRIAVKLSKICNDLRLLSSGPRAGLGEIRLPPMQAGSSIMPGKVNPVIPEVVNQVAYQVIGNDLTVTLAAEAGQLQLNAMEPVLIFNVLQSIRMLTRAMAVLTDRCVAGIEADTARCAALIENSLVLATALVPLVGYEAAAAIAKRALATGRTIADVALESGSLTREQLELALGRRRCSAPTQGRSHEHHHRSPLRGRDAHRRSRRHPRQLPPAPQPARRHRLCRRRQSRRLRSRRGGGRAGARGRGLPDVLRRAPRRGARAPPATARGRDLRAERPCGRSRTRVRAASGDTGSEQPRPGRRLGRPWPAPRAGGAGGAPGR